MNDIEVLEELRKELALYADGEKIKQGQALENLLKERQSDKERIKELTLNEKEKEIIETYRNLIKETGLESWFICNPETMWCNYFIPKSLIKEKIEELKQEDLKIYDTDSEDVRIAKYEQRAVLQVLEELLKGE